MAGKAGDVLKGKIAILSVNALGVDKFHTTPTVAARPGAEIHAVLTNQILDGKFLLEPVMPRSSNGGGSYCRPCCC